MSTLLPDLALGLKQVTLGSTSDDGQGENLRTAFQKFNDNMFILSKASLENLQDSRNLYVSPTLGEDTNTGLSTASPFKTVQKAINASYDQLLVRQHTIIINLMTGVYDTPVTVTGRPIGARSNTVDLIIKKASTNTTAVEWTVNALTQDYAIKIDLGARVHVQDITFSSTGTVNSQDKKTYILLDNGSYLSYGSVVFKNLGSITSPNSSHIKSERSYINIASSYTISGSSHTHIHADEETFVFSSSTTPAVVTAESSVIFNSLMQAYNRTKVYLPSSKVSFAGAISGKAFISDLTSGVLIDTIPNTLTVGEYKEFQTKAPVTFFSPLQTLSGFACRGPAAFTGTTNFSDASNFTASVRVSGAAEFTGSLTVPATAASDNSDKAASTAFVQTTIQNKVVDALPIATDTLFGIVKVNTPDANPVVYRKSEVDSLLNSKANLSSPTFTGQPKAPTRSVSDTSDNIATTQFVKDTQATLISVPSGVVLPFAGSALPGGYLWSDGSYKLRADLPTLFSAIGTTHGSTDSINFRLPNPSDSVMVGVSASKPLGSSGGSFNKTLVLANMPLHNHTVNDTGHSHPVNDPGHSHSTNDPGHGHTYSMSTIVNTTETGNAAGNQYAVNSGASPRPRYSNSGTTSSQTSISINGATSNTTVQSSSSAITINPVGFTTPTAVDITPKYIAMNYIIKI